MKKVLHITNWYPNKWDNIEGIFVKEQYKVFSEVTDSYLVNVQVREGKKLFEYQYIDYSETEKGYYLLSKIKSQKIIEILTTFLLLWALIKSDYKKYDLLHFHIAYPLLTYYSWWKRVIIKPILISEHWSAYHFNFYMPKETKKLDRVKKIFRQNIPLIAVSKALLKDIQIFSGTENFPATVIPNVIDTESFLSGGKQHNTIPRFFIVNVWRPIKKPFAMLKAFAQLTAEGKSFELIIGGYGELLEEMKKFVEDHNMKASTVFLGKMNHTQIVQELSCADAYLFSSEYETFSVACAQALTAGCPLIGPPIPAIMEYADNSDRVEVKKNDAISWGKALLFYMKHREDYDQKKIAKKAQTYFSNERIKQTYIDFLNEKVR